MKKPVLLVLLLAICLAMTTAAPVGAAPPTEDHYTGLEFLCASDGSEARMWFTGKDDETMHIRGAHNTLAEFFLIDDEWVPVGTNHIVANVNVEAATFAGPKWGTFHLDTDAYGDFEGTWSWGNGPEGRFSGKGAGDNAGKLMKGSLSATNPAPGVAFPEYPCGEDAPIFGISFAEYHVTDPHG